MNKKKDTMSYLKNILDSDYSDKSRSPSKMLNLQRKLKSGGDKFMIGVKKHVSREDASTVGSAVTGTLAGRYLGRGMLVGAGGGALAGRATYLAATGDLRKRAKDLETEKYEKGSLSATKEKELLSLRKRLKKLRRGSTGTGAISGLAGGAIEKYALRNYSNPDTSYSSDGVAIGTSILGGGFVGSKIDKGPTMGGIAGAVAGRGTYLATTTDLRDRVSELERKKKFSPNDFTKEEGEELSDIKKTLRKAKRNSTFMGFLSGSIGAAHKQGSKRYGKDN